MRRGGDEPPVADAHRRDGADEQVAQDAAAERRAAPARTSTPNRSSRLRTADEAAGQREGEHAEEVEQQRRDDGVGRHGGAHATGDGQHCPGAAWHCRPRRVAWQSRASRSRCGSLVGGPGDQEFRMHDLRLIGVHEDGRAPAAGRGPTATRFRVPRRRDAARRGAPRPAPAGPAPDRDRGRSAPSRGPGADPCRGDGRGGGRPVRVDGGQDPPLRGGDPRRAGPHRGPGPVDPGPAARWLLGVDGADAAGPRGAADAGAAAWTPTPAAGTRGGASRTTHWTVAVAFAAGGRQRQATWAYDPVTAHR